MKNFLHQEQEMLENEDFELGTTLDGDNIEINKPKLKAFLVASHQRLLKHLEEEVKKSDWCVSCNKCAKPLQDLLTLLRGE